MGFYNDVAFFRVIDGFMAQFGIHGDPKVNDKWESASINDDPTRESNVRGAITFATAGPNTRTTQLFINFGDNSQLDSRGFAPLPKWSEGMAVVDQLYKGYGEGARAAAKAGSSPVSRQQLPACPVSEAGLHQTSECGEVRRRRGRGIHGSLSGFAGTSAGDVLAATRGPDRLRRPPVRHSGQAKHEPESSPL